MKLTLPVDSNDAIFATPASAPVDPVAEPVHFDNRYLLVCEATSRSLDDGSWRFTLETSEGDPVFSAEDIEFGDLNRLSLLAAVRGLEAIEGASFVTLVSNNRYLIRSLSDSLPRWRQNDFTWEHFGHRVDVQHADLWRRIDRAIAIHRVEACLVSTRLISTGQPKTESDNHFVRIDSAHAADAGSVPRPKRRRGSKPDSAPSNPVSDAKGDRLRHWMMGGLSAAEAQPAKRRFTSEDLLEHDLQNQV